MLSAALGHNKVKNVLTVAAGENRVGHAYIFEGPRGVGRQTMAKEFAKLLMCENSQDGEPCGTCKNCTMCASGSHPDLQIITNQLYDESKKSTDVLVDTVRNMKKDIYIKPYVSERKIYIVPNADTMNMYAQNSLLKVLEEPPEYCTIILIAENSNLFLPTILSRAVPIKFYPLADGLIADYIVSEYPQLSEKSTALAAMSGGCIGRAKELAQSDEVINLRDELYQRVLALSKKGNRSIYDLMVFLKHNKDDAKLFMDMMQGLFRDIMYVKQSQEESIANPDKLSEIKGLADKISDGVPVKLLEILMKYNEYLSRNISYAQIAQCISVELWEAIND